jgi:hypothetical protein
MHWQPSHKRLIALFSGARGVHTFDIRKTDGAIKQLEYYNMHDYPVTNFDVGSDILSDYAITSAATEKYRYDVKPVNLKKPMSE